MVSEVSYEVHPALTSRISNVNSVVFVNRIREVVSFELGEEIKKDVFCLIMSIGQRKKF